MTEDHHAPRVRRVETVQDLSRVSSPLDGFLRRFRLRVKSVLSDGSRTDTFVVDYADRDPERRHAACVLPYARAASQKPSETQVILRSQVRYPASLVTGQPTLLESIAGIIEGDEGPHRAAVRELWEEGGIEVHAGAIRALGAPFFPSPGVLTEMIHVLCVELPVHLLEPGALPPPPTDGSPMEIGAELYALTLEDALDLTRVGAHAPHYIADAKTEIALRRLREDLERS